MRHARQMKLGMSIGSVGDHQAAWRLPDASPDGGLSARHYIESARLAERGKFDYVFVADVAAVRNIDDRRIARNREHGILKLDPTLALAVVAAATERVGLIPSVSTTYNPPYGFARRMASLDHISRGRAGWNMVTSCSTDEARNFSLDAPQDSPTRHAQAVEFVDVVKGLWDSWDDDAFVRDKASGIYFYRDRFHFLEHNGDFFEVRGPLDTARPPQGCLPIITAGWSEESQELAVRFADMVYTGQSAIESARQYYRSVKQRLATYGRDWESLKIMPGIMPFVGRTQREAEDKFARLQALLDPKVGIGMLVINHFPDLSAYDLDSPVLEAVMKRDQIDDRTKPSAREPNFTLSLMERARREKLTIRQLFDVISAGFWSLSVIGTPVKIADVMEEWFTTGAADGFSVQPPDLPGAGTDFVELVIPELQRRGLFRHQYEGRTLRENLGLPWVPSRYAARPDTVTDQVGE
jgi:FMN-dependent oxidoreductase (nitrilotriacetate monooxygenase family)